MSVSKSSFPAGMARCRHIKTNGTQCGSPALKAQEFCYYHQQNRPRAVELYIDGERYSDGEFMMPVFEDAHSIQTALRQVVTLLLQRRIERKDASLALYALQIASANLKTMQAERAKPTQVVVEPERVAETPLGMTPWSASGQGHDPDEEADEAPEAEDDAQQAQPWDQEKFMAQVSERIATAMLAKPERWCLGLQERLCGTQDRMQEKFVTG